MTLAAASSAGAYEVTGENEDYLPAIATIDKSSNVTITVLVPDLVASGAEFVDRNGNPLKTVSPEDSVIVTASFKNEGTAPATNITVQYALFHPDGTPAASLDPTTIGKIDVGDTAYPKSREISLGVGSYYAVVTATSDQKNQEIDLTDNSTPPSAALDVVPASGGGGGSPNLTVSVSAPPDPISLGGSWSFAITVKNDGDAKLPRRYQHPQRAEHGCFLGHGGRPHLDHS